MKKIFLIILSFILTFPAFAEPSSSVKGTIIDANSQTPLDFVNVAIFKKGSEKPIVGVISDKNGTFVIPTVASGNYTLRISFVGYNTVKQEFSMIGNAINLGQIKLEENSKRLKEVEVVGQGTQVKFDIDKKIYSVDQSIATAGGAASDVLKNIPSVKVDQEGNVSLRNDANVEVWINGKPSGLNADNRAQVLQQMPAESIESVEVMTNPSAKFNPEGTAGIINLVLKKNRKAGYFGSLSAGAMYPDGGGVRPTFGANINYSNSKIEAYANVGYRRMKFKGAGTSDRYNYNNAGDTLKSQFNQQSITTNEFGGLFSRAGIDFHPDTVNTISMSGFSMLGTGESSNDINYFLYNELTSPAYLQNKYSRNNYGTGFMRSYNLNLDFRHDFSKNENLSASASYSTHTRGADNEITQLDSLTVKNLDFTQHTVSDNQEWMFKADYSKKFNSNSKLEAGWQSTFSHRFSSSLADSITGIQLPLFKNDFDYYEQVHAAYATYGNRLFNALTLQAGIRGEYFSKYSSNKMATGTTDIPEQNSFRLFPSIFLAYSLPEGNELQLNVTSRVNHPRGRQINPFKDYSSAGTISYGKPDLDPEYSSAFELNYIKSWGDQSISATAYSRYTLNGIETVRFKNPNDIMESTYMNLSKRQNSGLELVSKNRLLRVFSLTTTINMYYSQINKSTYQNPYDSTKVITINAQGAFAWSANEMINFMLSKTLSGQITGQYSSQTVTAQGTQSPQYQIDLGLRKTLFDRKLAVSLMVQDILNTQRQKTTSSGVGFYQTDDSYFHRRMIGLTATWNFGNTKPKQSDIKKKQGGNDMMMDGGLD